VGLSRVKLSKWSYHICSRVISAHDTIVARTKTSENVYALMRRQSAIPAPAVCVEHQKLYAPFILYVHTLLHSQGGVKKREKSTMPEDTLKKSTVPQGFFHASF